MKNLQLLTSIRFLKSPCFIFKLELSSSISSTLTKLPFYCHLNLFAKTLMISITQAFKNFNLLKIKCKKWKEKGHFTPFLSILTISLYAKHKANLLPISPILILLLTLQKSLNAKNCKKYLVKLYSDRLCYRANN